LSILVEKGRKLFVTLHFLYLTKPDDSRFGPYECDAFAVSDPMARRHGFSITVLRGMKARLHKKLAIHIHFMSGFSTFEFIQF